jgi:secernin
MLALALDTRGRSPLAAFSRTHHLSLGGACAQNDPSFTYHNYFLVVDYDLAWILETAGRHWVAQRWRTGARNISNGLTVGTNFERHSVGLHTYARRHGWWGGKGAFDFAAIFSEAVRSETAVRVRRDTELR